MGPAYQEANCTISGDAPRRRSYSLPVSLHLISRRYQRGLFRTTVSHDLTSEPGTTHTDAITSATTYATRVASPPEASPDPLHDDDNLTTTSTTTNPIDTPPPSPSRRPGSGLQPRHAPLTPGGQDRALRSKRTMPSSVRHPIVGQLKY